MHILDTSDGAKEILEVFFLAESGELRNVVEPYVDDALYACIPKLFEKSLCFLIGKADREEFHLRSSRVQIQAFVAGQRRRYCLPESRMPARYTLIRSQAYRAEYQA